MGSEPENRTSDTGLSQPKSFKVRLGNALGFLWAITFSCSWWVGMYAKTRRPTHPMPNFGLIYPIPYGCGSLYVTRLEYVLACPAAFFVDFGIGISFVVFSILAYRKSSN
jgi:hypothetical protein